METVRKKVSGNLKILIERTGLSYEEFGKKFDVSKSAVSHWVSGHNSIDIETLANICREYDIPISIMLGESNDSEDNQVFLKYLSLNALGKQKIGDAVDDYFSMEKYRE